MGITTSELFDGNFDGIKALCNYVVSQERLFLEEYKNNSGQDKQMTFEERMQLREAILNVYARHIGRDEIPAKLKNQILKSCEI